MSFTAMAAIGVLLLAGGGICIGWAACEMHRIRNDPWKVGYDQGYSDGYADGKRDANADER